MKVRAFSSLLVAAALPVSLAGARGGFAVRPGSPRRPARPAGAPRRSRPLAPLARVHLARRRPAGQSRPRPGRRGVHLGGRPDPLQRPDLAEDRRSPANPVRCRAGRCSRRGDGSLWFGRIDGGLLRRLRDGVWRRYPPGSGLPAGLVGALVEDGQGTVWVGTMQRSRALPRRPLRRGEGPARGEHPRPRPHADGGRPAGPLDRHPPRAPAPRRHRPPLPHPLAPVRRPRRAARPLDPRPRRDRRRPAAHARSGSPPTTASPACRDGRLDALRRPLRLSAGPDGHARGEPLAGRAAGRLGGQLPRRAHPFRGGRPLGGLRHPLGAAGEPRLQPAADAGRPGRRADSLGGDPRRARPPGARALEGHRRARRVCPTKW